MILGYARVSTGDQNLDGQRDALRAAGAGRLFADTVTGIARHRPELDRLLDQLRAGDVVVVTKYDRLARSLKDLLEIVEAIEGKGAGFCSLAEDIGTTTPAGRSVFHVFFHRRVRAGPDRGAHARGSGGRAQAGQGRGTTPGALALPAGRGPPDAR